MSVIKKKRKTGAEILLCLAPLQNIPVTKICTWQHINLNFFFYITKLIAWRKKKEQRFCCGGCGLAPLQKMHADLTWRKNIKEAAPGTELFHASNQRTVMPWTQSLNTTTKSNTTFWNTILNFHLTLRTIMTGNSVPNHNIKSNTAFWNTILLSGFYSDHVGQAVLDENMFQGG